METHRSETCGNQTFTAFRRVLKALPFPLQFRQIQNKTLQQKNAEQNPFENQEFEQVQFTSVLNKVT